MHALDTSLVLEELLRQSEQQISLVIAQYQTMAPARLSHQPRPDSWSAAQCLAHLNFYGRFYNPAIEKAIREAENESRPAPHFKPGWLGAYFTRLMLPDPRTRSIKKMKAPKKAIPTAQPDPAATVAEFIEHQEKLIGLIRLATGVNLNKVRVPVSLSPFIRLRLGDIFRFLTAHTQRHLDQAARAVDKA